MHSLLSQSETNRKIANLVSPPEPLQLKSVSKSIPLERYSTRHENGETTSRKRKLSLRALASALIERIPKNQRNSELQRTVGFDFQENDRFECIEYKTVVHHSIAGDHLLASQKPETLNRRLDRMAYVTEENLSKDEAMRLLRKKTIGDLPENYLEEVKVQYELPPTTESLITFYVHELSQNSEGLDLEGGLDIIIFGGGASDALSNIGFAAQIERAIKQIPQLSEKVRRLIILPHLAGSTKSGSPVNPAMTQNFAPAAEIMKKALDQANVVLSNEAVFIGHSAGANMSLFMAEALKEANKKLHPRFILLAPALGENPNIDKRVAIKGLVDPYRWARTETEGGKALSRVQAVQYALRTVMNGWLTPTGPAKFRILSELARGKKPMPHMETEATQAGFEDELVGAVPNTQLLSADSSRDIRHRWAQQNAPVTLVWADGDTSIDPLDQRDAERKINKTGYQVFLKSRDDSHFQQQAEALFPGGNTSVVVGRAGSHFDVFWNSSLLSKALEQTLLVAE